MKKSKAGGITCLCISFLAIIAMFITANSFKSNKWTTIGWIIENFDFGYYWFIIGAVIFAVAGLWLLSGKDNSTNLLTKLWNNNVAMIILSVLLLILIFIIFSGDMLIFIITFEAIANGVTIFGCLATEKSSKKGRAIFIATVVALMLGLLFGLICGIDTSSSGCAHCNYKGYFGDNGGPIIDCPKC